jgi:uncharacterized protein with NRDE domain
MCLLLLAHRARPDLPLLLAFNRDEFRDRPTAPLAPWPGRPDVLAGRDLRAGGTWLGVSKGGRLAAVTNYREAGRLPAGPLLPPSAARHAPAGRRSRGELPLGWLTGTAAAGEYLDRIGAAAGEYGGFNLLIGDMKEIWYLSNRGSGRRRLEPGLHALSNHLLDTPWPKVRRGRETLANLLSLQRPPAVEDVLELLADPQQPPDQELPDTGVGLAWERRLSPVFIAGEEYGTRSSTVLLVRPDGRASFVERTHSGEPSVAPMTWRMDFRLPPSALPSTGGGNEQPSRPEEA